MVFPPQFTHPQSSGKLKDFVCARSDLCFPEGEVEVETVKEDVKTCLSYKLPVIFALKLPYVTTSACPVSAEYQAVVACGYDNSKSIPGFEDGALLFRNSWGEAWGEGGYGWLPYESIEEYALDFRIMFRKKWLKWLKGQERKQRRKEKRIQVSQKTYPYSAGLDHSPDIPER